jgi:hypothetical protein
MTRWLVLREEESFLDKTADIDEHEDTKILQYEIVID